MILVMDDTGNTVFPEGGLHMPVRFPGTNPAVCRAGGAGRAAPHRRPGAGLGAGPGG